MGWEPREALAASRQERRKPGNPTPTAAHCSLAARQGDFF